MTEAIWTGHVYGYAGYARMNRELICRISNSVNVQLQYDYSSEFPGVHPSVHDKLQSFRKVVVRPDAPFIRGYSPNLEEPRAHRICYTMMETETVHPHFIKTLNDNYEECWTPTHWNKGTFEKSGCSIPIRVMPLGVNQHIFYPGLGGDMMPLELVTTHQAGTVETPQGFLFLSLFQPTFRKGPDLLLKAFDLAFADDPEAALIMATTIHSYEQLRAYGIGPKTRARVYGLSGSYDDWELAKIFRACNAYVSASRGEGWNLPMCEAAACGLPVVAPRHSAHLDLADDSNAYLFEPEGFAPYPGSEQCSFWYTDQQFPHFGEKSLEQLVSQLREVKNRYQRAKEKAARLSNTVRTKYTWDTAAETVILRLRDLCGHSNGSPEQIGKGNSGRPSTDSLPPETLTQSSASRNKPGPPVKQSFTRGAAPKLFAIHEKALRLLQQSPQKYDSRMSTFVSEEEYSKALSSGDLKRFLYLAALVRVLQPRRILELGTDQGVSALFMMLGLPQNGTLITVDKKTAPGSALTPYFHDRRLHMVEGNDLDTGVFGVLDWKELDLLFLDTVQSYFQLRSEWYLYQNALIPGGLALIDDIHLNPEMERFWNELEYPKVDTGKDLHWSGLGLVEVY